MLLFRESEQPAHRPESLGQSSSTSGEITGIESDLALLSGRLAALYERAFVVLSLSPIPLVWGDRPIVEADRESRPDPSGCSVLLFFHFQASSPFAYFLMGF